MTHRQISTVKSAWRIIAFGMLWFGFASNSILINSGLMLLTLAELLGIWEEYGNN